jgi:hypothetical protein
VYNLSHAKARFIVAPVLSCYAAILFANIQHWILFFNVMDSTIALQSSSGSPEKRPSTALKSKL